MIWLWEAFGLCSRLKIIMSVRRQTIFSTPYFQFDRRSYFLFVYVMNTCDDLLCLLSWLVEGRGKQHKLSWKTALLVMEFYYQISVATLFFLECNSRVSNLTS